LILSWSGLGFCHATLFKRRRGWLIFSGSEWGRAPEVRPFLEPWASRNGVPAVSRDDEFAVGIHLATGQEREAVIAHVSNQLKEIAQVLSGIVFKQQ